MLNIKNPETHRLAHLLAEATHQSVTAAVTDAIREKLDIIERQKEHNKKLKRQRIEEILARIDAMPMRDTRSADEIIEEGWGGL